MPRLLKAALFGCLIGIIGLLVGVFRFAHDIEENAGLGLLFNLRGVRKAPSDVVVVGIDKESSDRLKVPANPANWPRSLYAQLIEKLRKEGARVIVLDLYFTEPGPPDEDNLLANAMKDAGNVVLAERLRLKDLSLSAKDGLPAVRHRIVNTVKPLDFFAKSAFSTAPFVLPRVPVKVNQYWTFQPSAGDAPTFPVVAFQRYASEVYDDFVRLLKKTNPRLPLHDGDSPLTAERPARLIRDIHGLFQSDPSIQKTMLEILERSFPVTQDRHKHTLLKSLISMYGGDNRRHLNFYGPPRTLVTVPFYRVLAERENLNNGERVDFKDKAVFVGLSENSPTEKEDSYYTVFSQPDGVYLSGIEIAATAFSNLLEDKPVKPISFGYFLLIILGWGILIGVVCRMAGTVVAALAAATLSGGYLSIAHYQFAAHGTWIPIVVPLFLQAPLGFFGAVFWNYFETNKERQNIRRALAYYVPNDVVHELAKNIVDIRRAGEMLYGVCLFTDAAEYTHVAEAMSPQQLSDFMHQYFESAFEPIKQNGGLVVDLKGDSILAVWKAARPDPSLREQACHAALEVARAVSQFNRLFPSLKLPTRVAVHAGQIYLGNIGAGEHYMYGPTGDTVNTASRMDGLNKYLGTGILVSDEVIQGLPGFLTRDVGTFRLKGKSQPVVVHELLCRSAEAKENQRQICEIFSEALHAFKQRSWDEARDKFSRLKWNCQIDGPARFYINLCDQYKVNAPEEAWEGVIPLEEK
ncbi:MAG: CHASE2 domain-containing protein [Chloroflexota bacterium]